MAGGETSTSIRCRDLKLTGVNFHKSSPLFLVAGAPEVCLRCCKVIEHVPYKYLEQTFHAVCVICDFCGELESWVYEVMASSWGEWVWSIYDWSVDDTCIDRVFNLWSIAVQTCLLSQHYWEETVAAAVNTCTSEKGRLRMGGTVDNVEILSSY